MLNQSACTHIKTMPLKGRALYASFVLLVLCLSMSANTAYGGSYEKAVNAVHAFENVFGVTEGKRRNHTKGFCITGTFSPVDDEILAYSSSPIFRGASSVIGRVSHKGGNNNAADNEFADYGLAIELSSPSGNAHIMNMNTQDFFPVATTEAFIELMRAKASGADAVAAFAAGSPELRAHKAHHSARLTTLRPYEGATYNSINSFYLVDDAGKRTAIRWSFVPAGEQNIVLEPSESFFFENMQENLSRGQVSWDMVVTIANPNDDILNPAKLWDGKHKKITAAKLRVTTAARENDGVCDEMSFDPLMLSDGFEPSEDPMLKARSAIYALGAGKRLSEQ